MATSAERIRVFELVDRNAKRATSYVRKASHLIHSYDHDVLPSLPVAYWTLLDQTLDTAADIVERMPHHYFDDTEGINLSDDVLDRARKVISALEARRKKASKAARIAKLEDTTGRTDEEAAAYRAKAAELRRAVEV